MDARVKELDRDLEGFSNLIANVREDPRFNQNHEIMHVVSMFGHLLEQITEMKDTILRRGNELVTREQEQKEGNRLLSDTVKQAVKHNGQTAFDSVVSEVSIIARKLDVEILSSLSGLQQRFQEWSTDKRAEFGKFGRQITTSSGIAMDKMDEIGSSCSDIMTALGEPRLKRIVKEVTSESIERHVESLITKLAAHEDKIEALQGQLRVSEEKRTSLTQDLQQCQRDLDTAQASLAQSRNLANRYRVERDRRLAQYHDSERAHEAANKVVANLTNALSESDTRALVTRLRAERNQDRDESEKLRHDLQDMKSQAAEWKARAHDLEIPRLKEDLNTEKRISDLSSENSNLLRQVRKLESDQSEHKFALERQAVNLKSDRGMLLSQLEEKTAESNAAKLELESNKLKKDLDTERRVSSLLSQLQDKTAEATKLEMDRLKHDVEVHKEISSLSRRLQNKTAEAAKWESKANSFESAQLENELSFQKQLSEKLAQLETQRARQPSATELVADEKAERESQRLSLISTINQLSTAGESGLSVVSRKRRRSKSPTTDTELVINHDLGTQTIGVHESDVVGYFNFLAETMATSPLMAPLMRAVENMAKFGIYVYESNPRAISVSNILIYLIPFLCRTTSERALGPFLGGLQVGKMYCTMSGLTCKDGERVDAIAEGAERCHNPEHGDWDHCLLALCETDRDGIKYLSFWKTPPAAA
ncbi:hypothetical protein CNYM01_01616 [Colletotrichum nymphaeae SA-01]|uniref:Uncharacterized protein n=1 Tax=Colletotrichum nymphaeae SA-01 TaxID=1460502 RepID=A0A135UIX1_9PEZI|nr:hypothetical protein CNYM01_01616 [Colletotrichum nymphaeae SA-01]